MIQFGTIFAVFLFSFSGAFYLALRGEVRAQMESGCAADNCNFTNNTTAQNESTLAPALNTSLNIYPYETSYVCHTCTMVVTSDQSDCCINLMFTHL